MSSAHTPAALPDRNRSATGVRGTVFPLTPFAHVTGMRFLDGTLYASTRDQTLVSIDPATGATTVVESFGTQIASLELFE